MDKKYKIIRKYERLIGKNGHKRMSKDLIQSTEQ